MIYKISDFRRKEEIKYVQEHMSKNFSSFAFYGHQHTGKTTMSEVLSELLNIKHVPEVARDMMFYRKYFTHDILSYQKIVRQLVDNVYGGHVKERDSFVMDRIPSDIDVYTKFFFDNHEIQYINPKECNLVAIFELSEVPHNGNSIINRLQITPEDYNRIDKLFKDEKEHYKNNGVKIIKVNSLNTIDRVDEIVLKLTELLK